VSATLLQLVNRVRREVGWEDVAAVSDRVSVILVDLIAAAQREALETAEWDFDIRSDGVLTTIAPLTYTSDGQVVVTNGSPVMTLVTANDYATVTAGASQSRVAVTTDASFGQTYFVIESGQHPALSDIYELETRWPGTTKTIASTGVHATILTSEYVLPTTVRDVLSVTVEEKDVAVEFIDRAKRFDQCVPQPFAQTSSTPEVCFVGGNTLPTTSGVAGVVRTPGLGLWLYPVPSEAYVVRYSYRYRHPALSAAADILYVPDHVADDIVDLAVARAFRAKIAHDPELAAQREISTQARLRRKQHMTGSQPGQRRSLVSHDRRGGGRSQFGSQPRNPNEFV